MSQYTTGELARLCGTTVRTVQYYDNRGILVPAELSEGGRRLYSDADLQKMKTICFLRETGMSLDSISKLLTETDSENVIGLVLEQQEQLVQAEIVEEKKKLQKLTELRKNLSRMENPDADAIGDVALILKGKKKLTKVRARIIAVGLVADIIEWVTILLWIFSGIWWPFAAGMPIVIAIAVWISRYYYNSVHYLCPECHIVFKPTFRDAFRARHTPTTRRLTCPNCGRTGFCVEVLGKEDAENG